jgi:hypothetical protein
LCHGFRTLKTAKHHINFTIFNNRKSNASLKAVEYRWKYEGKTLEFTSAQYICPATVRKCLPNAGRTQRVEFGAIPPTAS